MKFSIIIPFYNGAEHISKCLDSLLIQFYSNWEAICIDDGSFDNSLTLFTEYSRDERIQVYSQMNKGVAKAREYGLQHVSGDYIIFVDIDDTLTPNALLHLSQKIDEFDFPDIVVSGFNIIEGNRVIKTKIPHFTQLDHMFYLKRVLCGKNGLELWSKAYKRTLFDKIISVPRLRIGEDAAVLFQLICNAKMVVGCDVPIYNYIQHITSASHMKSVEYAEETIQAAFFIADFFKTQKFYNDLQKEIKAMCLLFYSNSTRKAYLRVDNPLMKRLNRECFKLSALMLLPFHKAIYIIVSILFLSRLIFSK